MSGVSHSFQTTEMLLVQFMQVPVLDLCRFVSQTSVALIVARNEHPSIIY